VLYFAENIKINKTKGSMDSPVTLLTGCALDNRCWIPIRDKNSFPYEVFRLTFSLLCSASWEKGNKSVKVTIFFQSVSAVRMCGAMPLSPSMSL
jgi:hypothetical protein